MANGQVSGKDLIEESVFQTLTRLDTTVADLIKKMNLLESSTRGALGGTSIGKAAQETASATQKANTALTEQEKVLRDLNRIRERNSTVTAANTKALAEERLRRQQINKFAKDEAVLTSNLTSAYAKLRKERDLAANTLRNLIVSEKASNREIRKATREFKRLDGQVKKADRAIGNFRDNVGNYGSAVRGVVGVSRQLLSAFGIFSTIQIGQEIFDLVKQLDSLKFGLNQVTEGQDDFNRAQFFLDEVAERSGASILILTNRYTNFLAAARSTTLTLKQTEEIFENVVVAGAALGRSQDDINGSLRALEQILSKGKVQAEELRGQLGERLPGAFQILEKALGLANGELNELLEQGGLLSTEAIPALTKGLEEAFKLETIDRVETLAAAQGRLTTEFAIFVRGVENNGGAITSLFSGVFNALTKVVLLLQRINGQETLDAEASGKARGYAVAIEAVTEAAEKQNITFKEAAEQILPRYNAILQEYGDILREATSAQSGSAVENFFNLLTGKFTEQSDTATTAVGKINLYNKALEALKEIIGTGGLPEDLGGASDAVEENANTLAALRERLKIVREEMETVALTTKNTATPAFNKLKGTAAEIEAQIKALTDTYKENKKALEEIVDEGSLKFLQDLEKGVSAIRDRTEVGSAAWVQYTEDLRGVERAIEELRNAAAILEGDLSSIQLIPENDQDLEESVTNFLNTQGLDALLTDFAKRVKISKEDLTEEFISLYGRDFEKFKEFEEKKIQALKDSVEKQTAIKEGAAELADTFAQSLLEIQLRRLDAEEERQKEVFDSVVNNKESSEEAIEQAEKDRLRSEKRINSEREKAEKNAFLFRQAVAASEIIIAGALARANVTATAALLPPVAADVYRTAQFAIIGSNTAFSLATVLAATLPEFFFRGKDLGNKYEGPAIWGELQREVKLSKDGAIEVSPDGAAHTYVKSSDIILKSFGDFRKQLGVSNSETSRRVRRGMERSSGRSLSAIKGTDSISRREYRDLMEMIDKGISKGFRRAKVNAAFNIYNDSKVTRVP